MSLETEPISSRLEKALSLRNMKQQELADRTKIPKSSISQYLSGYAEPKSDRAYIMAQVLDVSPVWLLGFDVPMENQPNEKTGELLVEIRKSPRLLRLVEDFKKLSPAQQESVLALIHSMIPVISFWVFSWQRPLNSVRMAVVAVFLCPISTNHICKYKPRL